MNSRTIARSRRIMREAFAADPDFKRTYIANVAMTMHDELHDRGYKPKLKPEDRDAVAEQVIDLIFGK